MQKITGSSFFEASQEEKKVLHSSTINSGKIPPQATSFEEAVLGAMLIDKRGIDEVIDLLTPEVFYKESHQEIFRAIQDLFHCSEPIDLYSVAARLKKYNLLEKIGGEYYLVALSQKVISSSSIEYHSRVVQQKFILRRLIEVSYDVAQKAYEESTDVFELLDKAESKLFEISHHHLKKSSETAHSLIAQAISKIKKVQETKGLSGVPSGFNRLDKITSGWQHSDLIVLAARPGMGKTAFVLSMARNMAVEKKTPVAFFSLEMSSVQLITRLIASETGISSEKLRKATLDSGEWNYLYEKVKILEEAPLFIDDTPSLSIFDLRAKARRLVSQQGIKLIIIDYLQLMSLGSGAKIGGNREQEISIISRSLKAIAKELDVPVIALSQLSRAVETRGGNKRPMLSDLRESGAIEQDADIVSFIYRPEYYGFDWEDGSSSVGEAELIIAKHRNGGLDNVKLKFIAHQAKFMDLPQEYNVEHSYASSLNLDSSMNKGFETPLNLPNKNYDQAFEKGLQGPLTEENEGNDNNLPF